MQQKHFVLPRCEWRSLILAIVPGRGADMVMQVRQCPLCDIQPMLIFVLVVQEKERFSQRILLSRVTGIFAAFYLLREDDFKISAFYSVHLFFCV